MTSFISSKMNSQRTLDSVQKQLLEMKTMELQILGSLFKIEHGQMKDGISDIQRIARKIKSISMSALSKCSVLEQQNESMKQEKIDADQKMMEMMRNMKTEISVLEERLSDSLLSSCTGVEDSGLVTVGEGREEEQKREDRDGQEQRKKEDRGQEERKKEDRGQKEQQTDDGDMSQDLFFHEKRRNIEETSDKVNAKKLKN